LRWDKLIFTSYSEILKITESKIFSNDLHEISRESLGKQVVPM
jgi:hypothetical protein